MPMYKVEVSEVRHARVAYWIEAADLAEASRKASIGDTAFEREIKNEGVMDRNLDEEPVPVESGKTPLEELVEFAEARGISEGALDSMVHDSVGEEAADINNGGLESQLEHLLKGSSGSVKAVKDAIIEEIPEEDGGQ